MGKLVFVYGPMNSGKSTELIKKVWECEEKHYNYDIIKSSVDTRENRPVIHSRAIGEIPCYLIKPDDNHIIDIGTVIDNRLDYIFVDEAQFFTTEQIDRLAEIADETDVEIVCYGLRNDFRTKLFEGSKRLFELADDIREIKSECTCGRKNIINARIDKNGKCTLSGPKIQPGAEELYRAKCRKCYYEDLPKK